MDNEEDVNLLRRALLVLVRTTGTLEYLRKNDPMALKQAEEALNATEGWGDVATRHINRHFKIKED